MLKEFINAVKQAEDEDRTILSIRLEYALSAKHFIETVIEARRKGGRNRHKGVPLKMDKASVANREAVRRHRNKQKNLK